MFQRYRIVDLKKCGVYKSQSQGVYDKQSEAAYRKESQGVYDKQSEAVYRKESQGVYDKQSEAVYRKESQGVYDKQSEAVHSKEIEKTLEILLKDYNYLNTVFHKEPLDQRNTPILSYTYPAIEFLNQFDFSERNVFEWAGGNLSLHWANISREIVAIGNDKDWFEKIQLKKNEFHNLTVLYHPDIEDYVSSIVTFDHQWDVIIIDGRYRFNCAQFAVDSLKAGGIIILNNSDWNNNTCGFLNKKGFNQIDFSGFGPISNYTWTTSVFFRERILLPRKPQTPKPLGGIVLQKMNPDDMAEYPNYPLSQLSLL